MPLSPGTASGLTAMAGDLCESELRTAGSTSRFLTNAILDQKKRRGVRS
jgi:hypothetical protein